MNNNSCVEVTEVFKKHAENLRQCEKLCNRPDVSNALQKVLKICEELENDHVMAPFVITDQNAHEIWRQVNLKTQNLVKTPQVVLECFVEKFLNFVGFEGPKVIKQIRYFSLNTYATFEFAATIEKGDESLYDANDRYEVRLIRRPFRDHEKNRDIKCCMSLIKEEWIPVMNDENIESNQVVLLLNTLFKELCKTWIYLKLDETPESSDNAVDEFYEMCGITDI